jgi:cytosine/adenosine deaminase-related metal-dependent hydrolase
MWRQPVASDETPSLLVKNIDVLVTMDDDRRVLEDAWLLVRGNQIAALGERRQGLPSADHVLDAAGHIVLPGLINTHHHFFQTLLRAVPSMQDLSLWYWLLELYLPMGCMLDEMNGVSTQLALAELMLSGCTTAQDHSYIKTNDMTFETQIQVAKEIGVRFHLSRGSMSLGESAGSIPKDEIVEDEDEILANCEYLIHKHHDPAPLAMTRVDIAPCSLFSVTPSLLERSAELARKHGVAMHTHCYESQEEEDFCLETYGRRPVQFAHDYGWTGPDTWYAHAVRHSPEEVVFMGQTGTGVAHCPSSNMRLASGIAPVRSYLDHGVRVGLGVDGSASNDSSHLLAEARMAMLLQRVKYGAEALTATQALEIATLGGASVLCRADIGALKPGMAADFIGFDLNQLALAGALHDPVAALVFCQPGQVSFSVINGVQRVQEGQILGLDLRDLIERHNRLTAELVRRTEEKYGHDLSTRIWKRA